MQIERFLARLERFLETNLDDILQSFDPLKPRQAIAALGSLQQTLEEAGLGEQLQGIEAVYGVQLKAVEEHFKSLTGNKTILTSADLQVAEQLITFDETVLRDNLFANTDVLASSVLRQVVAGVTPDYEELISSTVDRTVNQLKTDLTTATSGFSRAINLRKADELGMNLFVYIGPLDQVTRPFCVEHVNKVYTRKEIEEMDATDANGQGLPVSIYCGGYRCRHGWNPISLEIAKSEFGYTGEG